MPRRTERYKFRIKNGYIEIRVVLVAGQPPRYFTGKTYEDAAIKADEAVRLAGKDINTDPHDWGARPLGDWLDYWLTSVQRTKLQPTTFSQYQSQIRLYVKPHPMARKKLREVRYADIEAWRDWLESAPSLGSAAWRVARRADYRGPLEPKSIEEFDQLARLVSDSKPLGGLARRDIFQRLSTALHFAVVRRYIEVNPCDTVSRPAAGPSRKKTAPRAETIARLLTQIEKEKWGAAVYIAVSTGLRKGEVLALRWEDIELSVPGFPGFGEVRVGRQVQRLGRGIGLLVRESVKADDSEAVLPLPPLALEALERRRKEQSAEMLRAPKLEVGRSMLEHDHFHWQGYDLRPGQSGFVFTSEIGTIVDPRKFDRWFAAQRTKARMPKGYTFHRLRHDYASILLKLGVKDRITQEMLRHAQYSTTASIYQHVAKEDHFAAAQAVQSWIEKALA